MQLRFIFVIRFQIYVPQDVTSSALLGKEKYWWPHAFDIRDEHDRQWQSFFDTISEEVPRIFSLFLFL